MFHVSETILNKLRCNLCDGYLNAEPVVVKEGNQICAKCYKILPKEEKELCVRQISFEALGSCLVFPCRFHKMGCSHTFTWNNENGHETLCKKRYFTFPDVVAINGKIVEQSTATNTLEDQIVKTKNSEITSISSKSSETKSGSTNVAFSNDFTDNEQNNININIEGSVQFSSNKYLSPTVNECNNNTLIYENLYSTIPSISSQPKDIVKCLSCSTQVDRCNKSVCLFGHISCNNCKSDMCIACVKNLDGNSRIACKNASKGCQELLYQSDVGVHRDNCEFNEIMCPVEKCDQRYVLQQLVSHLKEDHINEIIMSNEITKNMGQKDKHLVFLCHAGIFKCLYYYYVTSVEIVVVYLGPCVKASEFCFEITVEVNNKTIRKNLMCANWNNYMLASGVSFDKKELLIAQDKPLKFALNLKILRAKL